jgi:hypothetical protein
MASLTETVNEATIAPLQGTKASTAASPFWRTALCRSVPIERLSWLNMNNPKDTLIGEEWMALRQIALGAKAAAIPRSVRTRLEVLDLISRDDYGQLVLTEKGRRLIATAN